MIVVSISRNRWLQLVSALAMWIVVLGVTACTGGRHFRIIDPGASVSVPPYLDLRAECSAGTLHFPDGSYVLNAMDDKGYYYRAPRKIVQRSFSGPVRHDGGIFVEKRDRRRLRGYVVMPGGLTHVGNLSGADYAFRDNE